jgi:hypothetical protein
LFQELTPTPVKLIARKLPEDNKILAKPVQNSRPRRVVSSLSPPQRLLKDLFRNDFVTALQGKCK